MTRKRYHTDKQRIRALIKVIEDSQANGGIVGGGKLAIAAHVRDYKRRELMPKVVETYQLEHPGWTIKLIPVTGTKEARYVIRNISVAEELSYSVARIKSSITKATRGATEINVEFAGPLSKEAIRSIKAGVALIESGIRQFNNAIGYGELDGDAEAV